MEKIALNQKETNDRLSSQSAEVESLLREISTIRSEMITATQQLSSLLDQVHINYQRSAQNLLHYLCLRRQDLRPLQHRLATLGLSSLGRAESHVLATIDAVLGVLHRLAQRSWQAPLPEEPVIDFAEGQRLLAEHTQALLGEPPAKRGVRIMVTMPSEAAQDYTLVRDLLHQGMDCMRINCAHDNAETWLQMIHHLRRAEQALGRSCQISMDLAGPKLRTGPIEPGPAVVKIRPQRDRYGRVTKPGKGWLTSESSPSAPPTAAVCLPVPETWLGQLQPGGKIRFTDARNAQRSFEIVDVTDQGCWVETNKTAYITPGTVFHYSPAKEGGNSCETATVGALPPLENTLFLQIGDRLILTRDQTPGRPASYDSNGQLLTPATIGCTIPEVFDDVRSGESVWFDDGKIGGVIEQVETRQVQIRITQTRLGGSQLRADKGINLPQSNLRLRALTAQDLQDLAFVAQFADIVELSFANTAHDVELLQQELLRLGSRKPAIVLKIETRQGFENLPDMLLTAMQWPCCGVMIARGDLAVECGFERLAEVQEEILWVCEAAHVPVIWATQVLETLAKEGMPSRAEITDAAMGHRAECVMLNKGPHVLHAVRVLANILERMQTHQTKKCAMLRELRLAHTLAGEVH